VKHVSPPDRSPSTEQQHEDKLAAIRSDALTKGLSVRELARRYSVHRRTVRAALETLPAEPATAASRAAPAVGPWLGTIAEWLAADGELPSGCRQTAHRIWQRLLDERGATVAESTVAHAVTRIRRELAPPASVPRQRTRRPGQNADVVVSELPTVVDGQPVTLFLVSMRLSYSGKTVHLAYPDQAVESFLHAHGAAFTGFGGIPFGVIRYDAVSPVTLGSVLGGKLIRNPRFVALSLHFGLEACFCPSLGRSELGVSSLAAELRSFRRRWFTAAPAFATLKTVNRYLAACDGQDSRRLRPDASGTVADAAAAEVGQLLPLPTTPFESASTYSATATSKAMVRVGQSYYSVPYRFAGRRLRVRAGARTIQMFADGGKIATHHRALHRFSHLIQLDHCLERFAEHPSALSDAPALAIARRTGAFTGTHQRFWDAACDELGYDEGTRMLIRALILARTVPAAAVENSMAQSLTGGGITADRLERCACAAATAATVGAA
jgi:hypothetical protein